MQEFCVKRKNLFEVLTMLGVFGALVSVCEMYPLSIYEGSTIALCIIIFQLRVSLGARTSIFINFCYEFHLVF